MYEINNTTFRNLEEQVQKNKEDIANHYAIDRAMSNLGIKVVGQVTNATQLPDPLTYAGDYGDTYAVGSKTLVDQGRTSYEYYVFTRPDPNSGQLNNYWLNVGKISIVGPQGVAGPEGPQGPEGESTKWFSSANEPDGAEVDDFWLNTTNNNVYKYNGTNWVLQVNIKGPQGPQGARGLQGVQGPAGPQGPQGEKGDVGGFINIRGILSSTDELPLPSQLGNLTIAYLIGASEPYDLYIQVGENSATATWNNSGPFNAATLVTVGGEAQNVWDADTKLDKAPVATVNKAYVSQANSGDTIMTGVARYTPTDNYLVQYDATTLGWNKDDGTIGTGRQGAVKTGIPEKPSHAVPKQYFEQELAKKVDVPDGVPGNKCVIGYNAGSAEPRIFTMGSYISGNAHRGSIACYATNGCLTSPTPLTDSDCATKKYVDDAVENAGSGGGGSGLPVYIHTYSCELYENGVSFSQLIVKFLSYKIGNQVTVLAGGEGYIDYQDNAFSIINTPIVYYEGTWSFATLGYQSGSLAYGFTFPDRFEIRNEAESSDIYDPNA